jgi:hypothetical protein
MLTDDEELRAAGNGAITGFAGGSVRGGEDMVWGSGECKGGNTEALGELYRERRGRRGDDRSDGHQWPWQTSNFDCHQRGGRFKEENNLG